MAAGGRASGICDLGHGKRCWRHLARFVVGIRAALARLASRDWRWCALALAAAAAELALAAGILAATKRALLANLPARSGARLAGNAASRSSRALRCGVWHTVSASWRAMGVLVLQACVLRVAAFLAAFARLHLALRALARTGVLAGVGAWAIWRRLRIPSLCVCAVQYRRAGGNNQSGFWRAASQRMACVAFMRLLRLWRALCSRLALRLEAAGVKRGWRARRAAFGVCLRASRLRLFVSLPAFVCALVVVACVCC